jgi:hypothetical protein
MAKKQNIASRTREHWHTTQASALQKNLQEPGFSEKPWMRKLHQMESSILPLARLSQRPAPALACRSQESKRGAASTFPTSLRHANNCAPVLPARRTVRTTPSIVDLADPSRSGRHSVTQRLLKATEVEEMPGLRLAPGANSREMSGGYHQAGSDPDKDGCHSPSW